MLSSKVINSLLAISFTGLVSCGSSVQKGSQVSNTRITATTAKNFAAAIEVSMATAMTSIKMSGSMGVSLEPLKMIDVLSELREIAPHSNIDPEIRKAMADNLRFGYYNNGSIVNIPTGKGERNITCNASSCTFGDKAFGGRFFATDAKEAPAHVCRNLFAAMYVNKRLNRKLRYLAGLELDAEAPADQTVVQYSLVGTKVFEAQVTRRKGYENFNCQVKDLGKK